MTEEYNFKEIESKWPSSAKATDGKREYDFAVIEKKWQDYWHKNKYGQSADFDDKPKHYHLVEFPYPSGSGLHVGHLMGYGASDAYCRMKRLQGFNVMFPIGWDAFGLPTENFAIKNKIKPQKATADNIITFKRQINSLGYAFDWRREINTTDPEYYHWTQWIFLQFYKHGYKDGPSTGSGFNSPHPGTVPEGKLIEVADDDRHTPRLAYQAEMPVNWCPSCKINLANEEVIDGKCERCGTLTEKRMQKQWMLRITAYADRLVKDLDTVDYLDKIKTQQINWIGKSTGTNVRFKVEGFSGTVKDEEIEFYTTRIDTLFGTTFVVVSPEHPILEKLGYHIQNYHEVKEYVAMAAKKSDLERTELQKDKTGVKCYGVYAVNPLNGEKIDIWVADYVLMSYGTGSVIGVPAHDQRDFEFATKHQIPIKQVVSLTGKESDFLDRSIMEYGKLINSGEFDGLSSDEGKVKITEKLKSVGTGEFATNYKLRDWIFSRQHYWGEPIPIVHCEKCGVVPLPEDQLPLILPEVENYEPSDTGESPLAKITDWVETTCPKCGGKATRETDTMPNWAGSSWYYLAYAMLGNLEKISSGVIPRESLSGSSPARGEVGWGGSMRDLELLNNKDSGSQATGRNDNLFSKSKDELKYWTPVDIYNGGMEHTTLHLLYSRFWHKFLFDLGVVPTAEPYAKRIAHGIILGPDGRKMSKSFGNVINPDEIVKQFGADTLRAYIMFIGPYDQESAWSTAGVQGVHRFLNRVWRNSEKVFDGNDSKELLIKLNQTIAGVTSDLENFRMNTVVSKLMEMNNMIEQTGKISKESWQKFLLLLSPVAPHIAAELFDGNILNQTWPQADEKYLSAEKITIVVQINGKVRDRIEVDAEISDEELKQAALNSAKVKELTSGKEIKKVIVVPMKLVSIVL